jgi:5-(carboxyamino)imidazole ribonucleotide synthase
MFDQNKKIGILGGGQLGKMLCEAASPWALKTWILDANPDFPAGAICSKFVVGDFNNFDDVLAFGRSVDVVTIEIEHVNTEALAVLEREGKAVFPSSAALNIIKDKGLQKQFYVENDLPTGDFELFSDENALKTAIYEGRWKFPFVQKTRTAGYDGRGVSILRSEKDLAEKLLAGACLAEKLADIQTEISVIVARNPRGEVAIFPPVEMTFHPEANMVEFLICPARISNLVAAQAETLAETVIEKLNVVGLLAVEMFLTKDNSLIINEVAPRPHNSGHHTLDAAVTSQFQQHIRAILDLPLGSTAATTPAVTVNLLGELGFKGTAIYEGMEKCLEMPGVFIHLYGKEMTAPMRKMGHATIVAPTIEAAIKTARLVQKTLKIKCL